MRDRPRTARGPGGRLAWTVRRLRRTRLARRGPPDGARLRGRGGRGPGDLPGRRPLRARVRPGPRPALVLAVGDRPAARRLALPHAGAARPAPRRPRLAGGR